MLAHLILIASLSFGVSAHDLSEDDDLQNILSHYVPRSKRELIHKRLNDPDRCVEHCMSDEAAAASSATTANTHRLIDLGMQDAKRHKHRLLTDSDAEIKQRAHELAVSNMGPLFHDLCQISRQADQCLRRCPPSQLRDIAIADHNSAVICCEPGIYWPSFTEYYIATDCSNKTVESKPCDDRCGLERKVSSATRLEVKKDTVNYDTDVNRNTEAATVACESITCHTNCYRAILIERCGDKAFETYRRMSKLEPASALAALQVLQVIDSDIPECKEYYI